MWPDHFFKKFGHATALRFAWFHHCLGKLLVLLHVPCLLLCGITTTVVDGHSYTSIYCTLCSPTVFTNTLVSRKDLAMMGCEVTPLFLNDVNTSIASLTYNDYGIV